MKNKIIEDKKTKKLFKKLDKKGVIDGEKPIQYLGEGQEAIVYGIGENALKIKKDRTDKTVLFQDWKIYQRIGEHPFFLECKDFQPGVYIVTNRIRGKTLGDLGLRSIWELKFFPSRLKTQILSGIYHCFKKGIIPKDLHLNNIMIDEEAQQIKCVDVGRFVFVRDEIRNIIQKRFWEENKWLAMLENK